MEKKKFLIVAYDIELVKIKAESKEELFEIFGKMFPAEVDLGSKLCVYDISETSPEKIYEMVEKYAFLSCRDFSEAAAKVTLIADLLRTKKEAES